MLKKIVTILTLITSLFIGSLGFSGNKVVETEKLSPLEVYKDNFWIFGDNEDQAFVQISFKYNLFKNYHTGIFLGYSQYNDWRLYDRSSPFKDINYNPELFVKSKYFFEELDYIKFSPYEHMSNGRDGKESRGMDRAYVQGQWSTGSDLVLGVNLKGFVFYNQEKCKYSKYSKFYEAEVFLTLDEGKKTKEELHLRFSGFNKGWVELGFVTRKLGSSNTRLYVQWKYGYMHNMLEYYNKENRLRAGLIFK